MIGRLTMMHKTFATILVFLMMAGTVSALGVPMPVSVQISNEGVLSGYEVTQTNQRTGEVFTLFTDGDGFALHDWSNNQMGAYPTDTILLEVVSCSEYDECTVSGTMESPLFFQIDLSDAVCPVCPTCQVCEECDECPDLTCPDLVCPDCNCPEQIVCEECETCEDLPADSNNVLGLLLTGLLGLGGGLGVFIKLFNNKIFTGVRTGMKVYRGQDGTVKVLHKHPGTKGYHDPNIVHRGREGHPKGQIDVADKYFKEGTEWVYGDN